MTVLLVEPAVTAATARSRDRHLDALRGLAVVCMVIDHAALMLAGPVELRWTVGRVAMPLFFLLGGHLTRRLGRRHLEVLAVGLVLGQLAPWTGAGWLLGTFVLGAALVALGRRVRPVLHVSLFVCLAALANPVPQFAPGYDTWALLALMLAGALLPRTSLGWARRLPRPLAVVGRYPLSMYAGHALLLTWATA